MASGVRRRRPRRLPALGALALCAVAGCRQVPPPPPPGIVACPLVVASAGDGRDVSYLGVIGRDGSVPPSSCVVLRVGEDLLAAAHATATGSFAIQTVAHENLEGTIVELHVLPASGVGRTLRYGLSARRQTASRIAVEPGSRWIVVRSYEIVFDGWLEPTTAPPIPLDEVWIASWRSGLVAGVDPTPAPAERFVARLPGGTNECATVVALHEDGAVGGCWWPARHIGCTPTCREEEYETAACRACTAEEIATGSCPASCRGRGCTVLDVDERHSGAPGPDEAEVIPRGPPPVGTDAGPPVDDGGPM